MATDPLEKIQGIGSARGESGSGGAGRHAGLGLQFALTLVAFAGIGHLIDGKLGTSPWLLVVGVMIGFCGGLLSLVRKIPMSTQGRASTRPEAPDEPA